MLDQLRDALLTLRLRIAQDGQRFVAGERVAEIAQVDGVDQLLGREFGNEAPQRLVRGARSQVPRSVDHRADGHVHDALFRAEPAQLRIVGEPTRERAQIGDDVFHPQAEHMLGQRRHRCGLHVVAAADGEHQAVTGQVIGSIGAQHDVGRRVIGIGIHRVRPIQLARGGEADVVGIEGDDGAHESPGGGRREMESGISNG